MTIGIILLWMAMQGQTDGPKVRYWACWTGAGDTCAEFLKHSPCDYPGTWQEVPFSEGDHQYLTGSNSRLFACKPPFEHLIEIKTKREITAKVCEVWPETNTIVGCECPYDYREIYHPENFAAQCEKSSREVWIDGVKWGILKESDSQ